MKTTLPTGQGFQYIVEVQPLAVIPGQFSLSIGTTWAGAKDPGERTSFQATLGRDDLLALRDLIDQGVRTAEPAEGLETEAWQWLEQRRRALWAYKNPPESILRFEDDPSVVDPSLLEPPLISAVKRLIELSPTDWPERELLTLL